MGAIPYQHSCRYTQFDRQGSYLYAQFPSLILLFSQPSILKRKLYYIQSPNTVKPRNSRLQNSGNLQNSGQHLNDQNVLFYLMSRENSGKPRNSGKLFGAEAVHYCEVLLYPILV